MKLQFLEELPTMYNIVKQFLSNMVFLCTHHILKIVCVPHILPSEMRHGYRRGNLASLGIGSFGRFVEVLEDNLAAVCKR
mmetsp:Transcript_17927/g.44664  ORF Transcript_17927/g.44664 Transcript_17927/m.44664 type:complete len:80 (+) Transcript_17927:2599-2838(+)